VARLLVCLPVCLLLAPTYPAMPLEPRRERLEPADPGDPSLAGQLRQRGFSPQQTRDYVAWGHASTEQLREQGYPPPEQLRALRLGSLAARDPVAFLEECLRHYGRHVTGYTLTMHKQERIGGKVQNVEQVAVAFKDRPHSVFFKWLEGARKAKRVLYVQGQNENRMVAVANVPPINPVVVRDLESPDAKASGRYSIAEFGLKKATQRVLTNWKKAQAAGALHVEYLGLRKVPKAGDRLCHTLRRTRYARPEDGGVTELILYIDVENLLQVGSVLLGLAPGKDGKESDGQFIAEYFFRDIRLNPSFSAKQFTRDALRAD
jgi:hypothetical protein